MIFRGRFTDKGTFFFSDFIKAQLLDYIKGNPNQPFEIRPLLPESYSQRRYFEGAIIPLITFYQEGLDHRSSVDTKTVRDWLKIEFCGDLVVIGGKAHRVPQSTKGKLNNGFLERVIGWIEDNYAPPREALDPEAYKKWRDTIFPFGGPDNYIDYLVDIRILTA